MEDHQIISLFLSRSDDAIVELKGKYGGLCRSVILNILHDPSEAEECLNDTLLGVWNAIPPAQPQTLSAFACRIARNLALKRVEYWSAAKRSWALDLRLHMPDNVESIAYVSDEDGSWRTLDLSPEWIGQFVSDLCVAQTMEPLDCLTQEECKTIGFTMKDGVQNTVRLYEGGYADYLGCFVKLNRSDAFSTLYAMLCYWLFLIPHWLPSFRQ